MEFDSQLLQDLLDFLRTLEGVELPEKFEALRGKLLGRMKTALSVASNYMHMQPGKPPKDHFVADNSSEDYVTPDQQPLSPRSFLYQHKFDKLDKDAKKTPVSTSSRPPTYLPLVSSDSLPPPQSPPRVLKIVAPAPEDLEIFQEEDEDALLKEYNTMTCTMARNKSDFFGQLYRKGKWLIFENNRTIWAALIGSHLLSYDNKTDPKPSQILSMKECTCRPLAKSQRHTRKQADSIFELRYEENKCFQFIASSPEQMEQWVTVILQSKNKTRKTKDVPLPPKNTSEPDVNDSDAESASDKLDLNEEYVEVDFVIDNIAEALATPVKPWKPKPKPVTSLHETKAKSNPHETANQVSPLDTKLKNRVLPPPPPRPTSSPQSSHHEEEVYDMINDDSQLFGCSTIAQGESPNFNTSVQEIVEDVYDDISTVKAQAKQISESKNSRREIETKTPVKASGEDDVEDYDDVGAVKKTMEQMKRNENTAKESTEIEKQRKSPSEPVIISTKPSPIKNFFGRFRQKSESPPKEEAKQKTPISPPQQLVETTNPTTLSIEQNSSESANEYKENLIVEDVSDYNSLPSPRPVQVKEYLPDDTGYNDGEAIYDEVLNRRDEFNNHISSPEKKIGSRKENENSVAKNNLGPVLGNKPQRNVVRNLNENFDTEIYANQPANPNLEDGLEFYQVPRADADVHMICSTEDDETDKLYDEVEIVAKKKRENEKAKEKPVLKTPPHTRGPAVMIKPSANNFANKLKKFTSPVAEKSNSEKNIQHRINAGKKPKAQKIIIPIKKREISDDDQIYDDCQTK